jgi:hypothetical protein
MTTGLRPIGLRAGRVEAAGPNITRRDQVSPPAGTAMIFAVLQVYFGCTFRETSSFLPDFTRIWL